MWTWVFRIAAVVTIFLYLKETRKGGCGCGGETAAKPEGKIRFGTRPIAGTGSITDIPYGIASVTSGKGIVEDSKTGRLGEAPYTGRGSA